MVSPHGTAETQFALFLLRSEMLLHAAVLLLAASAAQAATIAADSPLVHWVGRTLAPGDGSVRYDWLGTAARVTVSGATYLRAVIKPSFSSTAHATRSFVWLTTQNFTPVGYPEALFWISPSQSVGQLLYRGSTANERSGDCGL